MSTASDLTIAELRRRLEALTRLFVGFRYHETSYASGVLDVSLYTDRHSYRIHARAPSEQKVMGYLGCIAWARRPRLGERHTRGNDLPDGPLTEATYVRILEGIIGYELTQVDPDQDQTQDQGPAASTSGGPAVATPPLATISAHAGADAPAETPAPLTSEIESALSHVHAWLSKALRTVLELRQTENGLGMLQQAIEEAMDQHALARARRERHRR